MGGNEGLKFWGTRLNWAKAGRTQRTSGHKSKELGVTDEQTANWNWRHSTRTSENANFHRLSPYGT